LFIKLVQNINISACIYPGTMHLRYVSEHESRPNPCLHILRACGTVIKQTIVILKVHFFIYLDRILEILIVVIGDQIGDTEAIYHNKI
jgi:hypothetical protein